MSHPETKLVRNARTACLVKIRGVSEGRNRNKRSEGNGNPTANTQAETPSANICQPPVFMFVTITIVKHRCT